VKAVKIQVKRMQKDADTKVCYIPKEIYNRFKLSKEKEYIVHFGQLSQSLYFEPVQIEAKDIYICKYVFDRLLLYDDMILNIWKKNQEVFLGPVVGIFETPKFLSNILNGDITYYEFQNIKASISENCFSYYFTIEDIDWTNKMVKGVTFIKSLDRWEYNWFPMPNVLYDQGVFLADSIKSQAKEIRKQLRSNPNIKLINTLNGFGKWQLCDRLSKYSALRKYIPETVPFSSFDDVVSMINKHKLIFLKTFHGSKGYEVISIKKINKKYKLNYYDYGVKQIVLGKIKEVEEFVYKFMGESKFIVQQGIDLIKFNGHSTDLRVLIQKDEEGLWQEMYTLVKIAKGKATITNHAVGGDSAIYEQIYPHLCNSYPDVSVPTTRMLINRTIKIASYIEKEFGSFGEIGMDLGIDSMGNIWLIEANAKPDKIIGLDELDIYGRPLVEALTDMYQGSDKYPKLRFDNLEEPLPNTLAIFKYAKFLSMRENSH
jgi:hypothetical protein